MPNPAWFKEDVFLAQKAAQMNALNWGGKSTWTAAEAGEQIAAFPTTAFENFTACNTSGYQGVAAAQLNVAPNDLFNVAQYLANVATSTSSTIDQALATMTGAPNNSSAWAHYTAAWDTEWLNPSNLFDTRAYVEDVAQAWNASSYQGRDDWTADSAAAAIKAAGMNPVMHYYEVGEGLGITPTAPSTPANPPAGWTPWGTAGGDEPTPTNPVDPYDQNYTDVDIVAGQDIYPADGESYSGNTHFNAVWTGAYGASTLAANDVITGPAGALNSLVVDLGRNWTGFKQQTNDAGADIPSVTNVGRVVLNHGTQDTEIDYTFDASGISSDAVQYDLNAAGAGAISLSNVDQSVETINIRNLSLDMGGNAHTTSIDWAQPRTGKNDSLTIGVRNLGGLNADEEGVGAAIATSGIENVTINSEVSDDQWNYVDLSQMIGMTSLKITGSNDIRVTDIVSGVKTFDASAATGQVNMAALKLASNATVLGGSHNLDTVTLLDSVTITPAKWSGIEQVAMNAASTINARNVEGLSHLWVWNNGATNEINHLTASDFTVHQNMSATTTVNGSDGSLQNITYAQSAAATPIFNSNAVGNVNIHIGDKGQVTDAAKFNFSKATGNVTLTVDEDAAYGDGNASPTLAARLTSNFTADIQGDLNAGTNNNNPVFDVVNGRNAGGTVKFDLQNGMTNAAAADTPFATDGKAGIVLMAKQARELDINSNGDFYIADNDGGTTNVSDLSGIQIANIEIGGSGNAANSQAAFFSQVKMTSAQKVNITADGGDVTLSGALGKSSGIADLTVNVDGAKDVTLGTMDTNIGRNITVNVDATGDVSLNNITAQTNTKVNGQGDVKLTVSTQGAVTSDATLKIAGDDLVINFGDVTGDVASANGVELTAVGFVRYTGAEGADNVKVMSLGATQPSTFNMGGGADTLTIDAGAVKADTTVRLNIDMGSDSANDTVSIAAQTAADAQLILNVSNFTVGKDQITSPIPTDMLDGIDAAALTALQDTFGKAFTSTDAQVVDVYGGNDNGVLLNGTLYQFIGATAATATTMVALQDIGMTKAQIEAITEVETPPADEEGGEEGDGGEGGDGGDNGDADVDSLTFDDATDPGAFA